MSYFPKINLRRTFLIARRDFLGYVKTWGFWLSFLLPFIFGGFALIAAISDIDLTPTQYITVIDETGSHAERFHDLYDEMLEERAQAVLSAKTFFIQDKDKRQEFQRVLRADGTQAAQNYISENIPGVTTKYEPPVPCLLYTSPSPRDLSTPRMPSSA